jgi:hypothetical protein
LVVEAMPEDGDNGWVKGHAREMLEQIFKTGYLSPGRLEIYTISFTVLDNSLSQWRGYGSGPTGVSLGFDLRGFRPPVETGTLVSFAPCVYDDTQKKQLIESALGHFVEGALSLWKQTVDLAWVAKRLLEWTSLDPKVRKEQYGDSIHSWNNAYLKTRIQEHYAKTGADLLRVAALCKHSGFHEEQEWRLILPVEAGRQLQTVTRKFRPKGEVQAPYLESRLTHDGSPLLPLEEVVLGPGGDSSEAKASTENLLTSFGYDIPVRCSGIPFKF